MMKKYLIPIMLISSIILICSGSILEAYPPVNLERINTIPDLLQTHWKGHFDLGGFFHCGPVAASNSFAWFYLIGYRHILPGASDVNNEQIELAKKLGSSPYMNTEFSRGGTTAEDLVRGIEKYISECGYRNSTVTYTGWDPFHTEYPDPVRIPDMTFIKNGFENAGSVLLNIGWYVYDPKAETYTRKSGHWVTLAGYGMDVSGHVCPDTLVIHDPAPWAGKDFQNHYVRFETIDKGVLKGAFKGLPVEGGGFLIARQGLPKPTERVTGIIEGTVAIKMEIQFPFLKNRIN